MDWWGIFGACHGVLKKPRTKNIRRYPLQETDFCKNVYMLKIRDVKPTGAGVVAATAGAARSRRAAMDLSAPAHGVYTPGTGARCDQRTDSDSPARCEDATFGGLI